MYARMLYHSGGYKAANEAYEKLYPVLRGRGAFLFEYGHSLHKSFLYGDSNKYLEEACRYSSDPMVLNVMGKIIRNNIVMNRLRSSSIGLSTVCPAGFTPTIC